MNLQRVSWTNPARTGRLTAVLCDDHARSLLSTLRRLRIGAGGGPEYDNRRGCDQCRGRDRKARA
jgi:hypothetical protein